MIRVPRTILPKYFTIKSIESTPKAIRLKVITRAFLTRLKKYHQRVAREIPHPDAIGVRKNLTTTPAFLFV